MISGLRVIVPWRLSPGVGDAHPSACVISALVHEHGDTWPLQGTEAADSPHTKYKSLPETFPLITQLCVLRAGWRTRRCSRPSRSRRWTAARWATLGGGLAYTAWMADITSRCSPTGRCRARGRTGTLTVRLRHDALTSFRPLVIL